MAEISETELVQIEREFWSTTVQGKKLRWLTAEIRRLRAELTDIALALGVPIDVTGWQTVLASSATGIREDRDKTWQGMAEVVKQRDALQSRLNEALAALKPFAEFSGRMDDGPDYAYMQERIKDWFGVSDFKEAAAVLEKNKCGE